MSGRRGISPDMALRLERAFGGSAAAWLRMQVNYNVAQARVAARNLPAARLEPHRV